MSFYDLVFSIIGYSPSGNYYSWETYYLQGAIALLLIFVVVFIDLLYRFLMAILKRNYTG